MQTDQSKGDILIDYVLNFIYFLISSQILQCFYLFYPHNNDTRASPPVKLSRYLSACPSQTLILYSLVGVIADFVT